MQEQNVVSMDYLGNSARFADLLNGFVYHGVERVRAGDIRELSSSMPRISKRNKGKQIHTQVITADIVREMNIEMKAVIVALENQTDIHYAIPVRVMTHSRELLEYKRDNASSEGGENMCQAILEMIEDGRQEGIQEGIQEGMKLLVESFQEIGISKEITFLKMKEKYRLTEEQANEKIALYWVDSSSAFVDATK